jgi:hypothetical protein
MVATYIGTSCMAIFTSVSTASSGRRSNAKIRVGVTMRSMSSNSIRSGRSTLRRMSTFAPKPRNVRPRRRPTTGFAFLMYAVWAVPSPRTMP